MNCNVREGQGGGGYARGGNRAIVYFRGGKGGGRGVGMKGESIGGYVREGGYVKPLGRGESFEGIDEPYRDGRYMRERGNGAIYIRGMPKRGDYRYGNSPYRRGVEMREQIPPSAVGSVLDDSYKNPNKIFIRGLSMETTTWRLKNYMKQYGSIIDIAVVNDKFSGKSRGFGFCTFASFDSVQKCLQQKHKIDGVPVEVCPAIPRSELAQIEFSEEQQNAKIFVGGLPLHTTEAQIVNFFEKFGAVKSAMLMYDKITHKQRDFAFVTFCEPADADRAVGEHKFLDNVIEAKKAAPRNIGGDSRKKFNKIEGFHYPYTRYEGYSKYNSYASTSPALFNSPYMTPTHHLHHGAGGRGRGGKYGHHYFNGGAAVPYNIHESRSPGRGMRSLDVASGDTHDYHFSREGTINSSYYNTNSYNNTKTQFSSHIPEVKGVFSAEVGPYRNLKYAIGGNSRLHPY